MQWKWKHLLDCPSSKGLQGPWDWKMHSRVTGYVPFPFDFRGKKTYDLIGTWNLDLVNWCFFLKYLLDYLSDLLCGLSTEIHIGTFQVLGKFYIHIYCRCSSVLLFHQQILSANFPGSMSRCTSSTTLPFPVSGSTGSCQWLSGIRTRTKCDKCSELH